MNGEKDVTIQEECAEMRQWQYDLDETAMYGYVRAESRAGGDPFVCEDWVKATQICRGIANNEKFKEIECGGAKWSTGDCGSSTANSQLFGTTGYEVYVSEGDAHDICRCTSDVNTAIFRPCLGNYNWGGFRGLTCRAPKQDMLLTCGMGVSETPEPTPEPTTAAPSVSPTLEPVQPTPEPTEKQVDPKKI